MMKPDQFPVKVEYWGWEPAESFDPDLHKIHLYVKVNKTLILTIDRYIPDLVLTNLNGNIFAGFERYALEHAYAYLESL